jgi:uncharacterized DUF497 family protein
VARPDALIADTANQLFRQMVQFNWDDENRAHIAAHSVSCAEAEEVVTNEPFDLELQTANGEERFVQLGETNGGRILVVVSTWRKALIRVVTAFDAPKAMKRLYIVQKGNLYGTEP